MRRTVSSQAEAPGQDSFLDVVANLVGIIIIMVMIVSTQAKQAFIAEEERATPETPLAPALDVAGARAAAGAVEANIGELQSQIERQAFEVEYRKEERDQLQTLVTLAEQQLAENRSQMSEEERASYDLQEKLLASKGELERLGKSMTSLTKPPPTVLQHLPTPMARTVFGTEVQFRLLGGRLAYIPWEEMKARLEADAQQKVYKLKSAARIEESLPVISGFGAKYILRRSDVNVKTAMGSARQSSVELERIYFVDAEDNLGEPVDQALQSGSAFRSRLAGQDPKRTTITIWVYPDSFDQFRQLKTELFKLGYLTAARPLPAGLPIGGAPNGTRAVAE